jgi:hypothetical protein
MYLGPDEFYTLIKKSGEKFSILQRFQKHTIKRPIYFMYSYAMYYYTHIIISKKMFHSQILTNNEFYMGNNTFIWTIVRFFHIKYKSINIFELKNIKIPIFHYKMKENLYEPTTA